MFYILETESQLERLEGLGDCNCFCEIITTNDNFHPRLTGLVAVYIRPFTGDTLDSITEDIIEREKGYIIPVAHDEGLNVAKERVQQVLEKFRTIWVINKKSFLYHFILKAEVKDISLKYAMLKYDKLNITVRESTYNWFYNRYGGMEKLNQIIPLSKLYQKCEDDYKQIKDTVIFGFSDNLFEVNDPAGYSFYNEQVTKAFFLVEQAGLRVDRHSFIERFKPNNPDYSIVGETVYTSYNLYNATSRPTNSFNSVNFLAIPKSIEFRRCFKPRHDRFVELDQDGYHIRLVADLVGYELDSETKAHKQLAELRAGKEVELTSEDYTKAKAANFKMIYGTPSESDRELKLSQKVQEYINSLWKSYESGIVKPENPYSHKEFRDMEDMYPNKLFNYMIQSVETSRNVLTLCKVLGYMSRYHAKSEIVLITYDAFLIDYADSDGPELLDGIRKIMEGQAEHRINGTPLFPVKLTQSKDLNFE